MRPTRLGTWPPLPPDVYLRPPAADLPFPLQEPGCRIFSRARQALWHGVRALGLRPGDEVLVPAYHHGSEVEALVRAGLVCRFYDATETLAPDPNQLEALHGRRTRALYLTHYLGFPQDAAGWLGWCRQRGLLLIEDAAQAWLATVGGRPAGSFGDLSIFCLYKMVGVPDGGVVVSASPPARPIGRTGSGAVMLARRHGGWVIQRSGWMAGLAPWLERSAGSLERELALGDVQAPPAAWTSRLLPRLLQPDPRAVRRLHYRLLLDDLGDQVPKAFAGLPEGACPFAFPLETADKATMMERLERHRIIPLDLWSNPHPSLPVDDFPAAAQLRRTVVGLPVHQELRPDDVERLVEVVGRAPGRPSDLDVEVAADLAPLQPAWSRLAERSQNLFATWEWASTWWRHHGHGRQLLVATVRSAGRLVGILPLYVWRTRPLRVLRFLGHGPGDELGPVCAPADRQLMARALRRLLSRLEWDLFLGEHLPGQGSWPQLLGGQVLAGEGSPLIRFGRDGWDGFLQTRSRNLRGQLRRRPRKLAREHRVRYRLADGTRPLQQDLDELFRLHQARWGPGRSSFAAHQAFHRAFAATAQERGWLRLWFLEVDGETVAALYGFRFAGTESHYQSGRDPAWAGDSVGFVLLAHAIRQAATDGVGEYRLLRGGEGYKYRFATADAGIETVGVARGLAAGVALPLLNSVRTSPGPLGRASRGLTVRLQ